MKKLLLFGLLITANVAYTQPIEVAGEVSASAIFSNEDVIPFWMYANSNFERGSETNYNGIAAVSARYSLENAFIEVGVSAFYRDDVTDEFQRKELFLRFQNSWLKVTAGSKGRELQADGLSSTNKNFLWSGNIRPLTGLIIEANEPLRLTETFAIDWGIAHYRLNDDRFVSDVNVHYKRLALIATINDRNKLTARLQHFAQWGGNSPVLGALPNDFKAYFDVFFAKKRSLVSNNITYQNALGNHLGSYFIEYETSNALGEFNFYHEHPFEDGSGTRFANFPDGVWGAQFRPNSKKIITQILYEYVDTSDQSGSGAASGIDGYFGNNVYRSGWSYEQNVIGFPFILFDPTVVINDRTSPYVNNRSRIHHLGVSGSFEKIDWTVKTTLSNNLGTYRRPFMPQLNNWHNYLSIRYRTESYGAITLIAGADFSNLFNTVTGVGVRYQYSF
jgi:hypothetical protein